MKPAQDQEKPTFQQIGQEIADEASCPLSSGPQQSVYTGALRIYEAHMDLSAEISLGQEPAMLRTRAVRLGAVVARFIHDVVDKERT